MLTHTKPSTLLDRLERWQWLLPVLSFVVGWVGYLAIERGPTLARVVALTALLSWVWLLLEPLAGRWLNRISNGRLSEDAACFVTQSIQQELLFFSAPFVIGALQIDAMHGVFVMVLFAAALLSTLDPIYQKWVASSPVAAVAFQVYCTWVAALVLLPIALHLPLESSAPLAAIIGLTSLLVGLPRLMGSLKGISQCLRAAVPIIAALLLVTWFAWALPPAGLRLTEARITNRIDGLTPGPAIKVIDEVALHRDGLIAFTAVHAPAGLKQGLSFDWYHGRKLVDSIPAEIEGPSETPESEDSSKKIRGWRTWTRKQNFDGEAKGNWHVDIRTAGGQLIGRLRFRVVASSS